VELVDGGTQGLYLVHYVQAASHLLIFDAVDYGLAPGEIKIVEDDEVPKFMGAKKMSLHQTGFQEVLMLAKLTERFPRKVLLVGCQPEQIDDYGGSLTPKVKAALEQALDIGVKALEQWGAAPRVRTTPLNPLTAAAFNPLDMAAYEAGRPSEDEACRVGDDRFMPPATALAGAR
jgi:hydrogenase maturation protease